MSGYLVGLIISSIAAIGVTVGAIVYLRTLLVRAFMSLGSDDNPYPILLLMLGGYLLIAAAVAVFTNRTYNTRTGAAFLINIAPLVAIVLCLVGWREYRDYSYNRNRARAAQIAINDAPAIHLGVPYVTKVEVPTGGVILLLHVPLTVDRTVRAHSLNFLAMPYQPEFYVQFSSKRECNSGFGRPSYGYHIVDREYTEPPLPLHQATTVRVAEELHPGTQYYLLRELHFGHSHCRLSDYEDFDPKQISVTLDTSWAMKDLEER